MTAGATAGEGSGRLETLDEDACLELLRSHAVGRIVFVDGDQPKALPVNYVVEGRTVAFRSDPGTALDATSLGKVALEIDGIDEGAREGWSVLVTGVGRDVTEAIDEWSEAVRATHLTPWAAGERRRWVAIANPTITGRRIGHESGAAGA